MTHWETGNRASLPLTSTVNGMEDNNMPYISLLPTLYCPLVSETILEEKGRYAIRTATEIALIRQGLTGKELEAALIALCGK